MGEEDGADDERPEGAEELERRRRRRGHLADVDAAALQNGREVPKREISELLLLFAHSSVDIFFLLASLSSALFEGIL